MLCLRFTYSKGRWRGFPTGERNAAHCSRIGVTSRSWSAQLWRPSTRRPGDGRERALDRFRQRVQDMRNLAETRRRQLEKTAAEAKEALEGKGKAAEAALQRFCRRSPRPRCGSCRRSDVIWRETSSRETGSKKNRVRDGAGSRYCSVGIPRD